MVDCKISHAVTFIEPDQCSVHSRKKKAQKRGSSSSHVFLRSVSSATAYRVRTAGTFATDITHGRPRSNTFLFPSTSDGSIITCNYKLCMRNIYDPSRIRNFRRPLSKYHRITRELQSHRRKLCYPIGTLPAKQYPVSLSYSAKSFEPSRLLRPFARREDIPQPVQSFFDSHAGYLYTFRKTSTR